MSTSDYAAYMKFPAIMMFPSPCGEKVMSTKSRNSTTFENENLLINNSKIDMKLHNTIFGNRH
ncbi:hypothetical protein OA07_04460 [Aphanizomenon flos-aquae 2012/KM1/D3]|nr:hypothetical protein OA07_04460 [Aphanizomenon flos-aquae 2012/KM1/D3]